MIAETTALVLKVGAWLSLLSLTVITLGPISLRPHSGLSVHLERFAAFAAVGVIFALAYPKYLFNVAVVLVLVAILLEVLQLLSPGRHGRLIDALMKISGAVVGLAAVWLLALLQQS